MTFKEKLQQEQPDKINHIYVAGCENCPDDYGYETSEESRKNCRCNDGKGCEYCWNREFPKNRTTSIIRATTRLVSLNVST